MSEQKLEAPADPTTTESEAVYGENPTNAPPAETPAPAVSALPAPDAPLPEGFTPKPPPEGARHAELWVKMIVGGIRKPTTFQTFFDPKGGSSDAFVFPRVFHDTFARLRRILTELNKQRSGIFAVVNACDPLNADGLTRRRVVAARANFSDDDYDLRRPDPLPPHMIVSSKSGAHTYWLTDPSMTLIEWIEVQWIIAWVKRTDPAMINVDRVLRLPGAFHQKNPSTPYFVRIVHYDPPGAGPSSPRPYTYQDWCTVRPPLTKQEKESLRIWYSTRKLVQSYFVLPDLESPDWRQMMPRVQAFLAVHRIATRKALRAAHAEPVEVQRD